MFTQPYEKTQVTNYSSSLQFLLGRPALIYAKDWLLRYSAGYLLLLSNYITISDDLPSLLHNLCLWL